jgi:hypothetical protein
MKKMNLPVANGSVKNNPEVVTPRARSFAWIPEKAFGNDGLSELGECLFMTNVGQLTQKNKSVTRRKSLW